MSSIAFLIGRRINSFASKCCIIQEARLIKNLNQYSYARPSLTPILQHQLYRCKSQLAIRDIKFRANCSITGSAPYTHTWLIWRLSRPYSQPSNESTIQQGRKGKNRTTLIYVIALAIAVIGLSYAAVPLYRVFCQVINTLFHTGS